MSVVAIDVGKVVELMKLLRKYQESLIINALLTCVALVVGSSSV